MKEQTTESEALKRAATFCAAAEHCPAEVRERLPRWGIADARVADRIVEHLRREGFVDEGRYCRAYVRDKYRFAKWGRLKIAQALRAKHLPSDDIAQALLEEIDEDEYQAILRALLDAKQKVTRARDGYELRAKLMRFALGRGFEPDAICRSLQRGDE